MILQVAKRFANIRFDYIGRNMKPDALYAGHRPIRFANYPIATQASV